MFLFCRPGAEADIEAIRYCGRDLFAFPDAKLLDQRVNFARQVVHSGTGYIWVIEDREAEYGERITWFCLHGFARPEFVHRLKTDAPPFVCRVGMEWLERGERPFLDKAEVRAANTSGGLSMVIICSGAPPGFITPQTQAPLFDMVTSCTYFAAGGYRLNELLLEFYDAPTFAWGDGAGMYVRRDHGAEGMSTAIHGGIELPPGYLPPRLYGISYDEAIQSEGTVMRSLFNHQPPRFGFSAGEQEMLLHALQGETDHELAARLCVALVTIKKRWVSVVNRVAERAPQVLGTTNERDAGRRGAEKRRHILNYLRNHLEELRPV